MTKKDFTDKWNVAYEDLEQKREFEIEMKKDLNDYAHKCILDIIKAQKEYNYNLLTKGGKIKSIDFHITEYFKDK